MKITVSFMKKNASLIMLAMLLSLMFVEPSFAWQASVTKVMDDVAKALGKIAVSIITIAFIFAGFQIAFNGKTVSAVAPIVIGAVVIGAAALIAKTLIT